MSAGPVVTISSQTESTSSVTIGEWQPEHLAYGNHTALVYRDIQGWHYQFQEVGQRHCTTISSADSRTETISAAKKHLAQAAYVNGVGAENGLGILTGDHHAIIDHLHWIGFQRAYAFQRASGAYEAIAHGYACANASDPGWLSSDEIRALDDANIAMRYSAR